MAYFPPLCMYKIYSVEVNSVEVAVQERRSHSVCVFLGPVTELSGAHLGCGSFQASPLGGHF